MNIIQRLKEVISGKHKELILLIFLFLFSLIIRLTFFNSILKFSPFLKYPNFIRDILSGREELGTRLLDFSAFYTAFQFLTYGLLHLSVSAIEFFQLLLGSINVVLIYLIGKRMFNKSVGVIASFIYAIYGNGILYEGTLEPLVFVLFFILMTVLLLLRVAEKTSSESTSANLIRKWLIPGIIIGFSTITRPNIVLLFIFLILWMTIIYKKRVKTILVSVLGLTAGILLVLIPTILISYKYTGSFGGSSMSPGQVFHQGNSPGALGLGFLYPPGMKDEEEKYHRPDYAHELYRIYARRISGKNLSAQECTRFWLNEAFNFIRKYPKEYIRLLGKKFFYFWNGYEQHQILSVFDKSNRMAKYPLIPFSVIAPLGILGIFFSFRTKKENIIGLFFILAYLISGVTFYICSRQRVPAVPFLIIYGAYTGYYIFQKIIKREFKSLFLIFIVLVLLFKIVSLEDEVIPKKREILLSHIVIKQAVFQLDSGNREGAKILMGKAIKYNPRHTIMRLSFEGTYDNPLEFAIKEREDELNKNPQNFILMNELALLYMYSKRTDEAKQLIFNVIERNKKYHGIDSFYNPYINLSYILCWEGKYDEAIEILGKGIKSNMPLESKAVAKYLLSVYYEKTEEFQKSKEALEDAKNLARDVNPDPVGNYSAWAFLSVRCKDFVRANKNYEELLKIRPTDGTSRFNYAYCLFKSGQFDEALTQFALAKEYNPRIRREAQRLEQIIKNRIK